MSYDSNCYALAKTFLEDEDLATEEAVHELAETIQSVIEAFIEFHPIAVAQRELNVARRKP